MPAPVLVAYAPRHGFTQEVAEVIAAALREDGVAADVQPKKAGQLSRRRSHLRRS